MTQGSHTPASEAAPDPGRVPDRLRRSQDFAATMRTGRRARHALLTAVARRTQTAETRVGFAVSRRIGGAVVRNRVKRQLLMITRAIRWQSGIDVVIVPQPVCANARFEEIAIAIMSTCEKMGILMRPAPAEHPTAGQA
ncbi:MAG: ribonuclease P protein component [Chloroflexi bacterium]|nr:MAG: ribonuclease P protein component [Chloroflexota bacterium]